MLPNKITDLFKIKYPIIQAPMAGGITTEQLVAAVSNHGGLGMIGAGYMSSESLKTLIREVKKSTEQPFGVNVFVPDEFEVSQQDVNAAKQTLQPYQNELDIQQPEVQLPKVTDAFQTYHDQIQIIIDEKVPICSFTFGIPSKEMMEKLKQHGVTVVGTATTVKEAQEIEKLGMDAVVAQGSEAGGHRGNFLSQTEKSLIGTMSLVPQVADAVEIPVIAAGGIMDRRGLKASICLGALGVQMGTAFLTCVESGVHPLHKKTLLQSTEEETTLTRAFSGKWARGINNRYIQEMKKNEEKLPAFPVLNVLTQPIRKAAASQNKIEFMSLWSGQSPRLAKKQNVQELIKQIISDPEIIN
ncbi:NAD(P)H-dependent flavin oxidoreductase [Oceanobacillus halophilus]|uniref:Probable nitronate monooxygenase n=1 Tax=Oceanobacillus halophilus TaxID=930130 RepID=A0A495A4D0_9BACI|nr:nitronate monooxygenase [Oceanobacillus halophilus]RKQ34596.1 nitronate monooxygenase [Oceanobacillus halophilus]